MKPHLYLYKLNRLRLSLAALGACPSEAAMLHIARSTVLAGRVLAGTVLLGTVPAGTILTGTILTGTVLTGTVLTSTILAGTVLANPILNGTVPAGTVPAGTILPGPFPQVPFSRHVLAGTVLKPIRLLQISLKLHSIAFAAADFPLIRRKIASVVFCTIEFYEKGIFEPKPENQLHEMQQNAI